MYIITKLLDDKWHCAVSIQDGTERWTEPDREKAVQSVISAARVLNGSYITEKDIRFHQHFASERAVSEEDWNLLRDIRCGAKIVLDHSDPRIRYNLSDEDCETIIQIREGKIKCQTR